MKPIITLLSFLFLLLLTGCPVSSLPLYPPPQYAEDGTPADPFFDDLAQRTSEMAEAEEIPSDPDEALRVAHEYFAKREIKIIPKASGLEKWEKFTTATPSKIFVSSDWDAKSTAIQAEILWHEIVHLRQYDAYSPLKMGTLYVVAEGRWAIEVQAYRESFRVKRLFGMPEEAVRDLMETRAENLYDSYELGAMPREYAVQRAVEIWMLDSPLP